MCPLMKPESRTILPSPDTLNNLECGKFVLSNLAAKRAKQIKDGASPLIRTESNHPLSIALAEIAAGKIRPNYKTAEEALAAAEMATTEEVRPNELGILLPGLDDSEFELVGIPLDDEEEHEMEEETDASLLDLLGDEEEEADVETAESDEDTLSLSDIASEEEKADDEEGESEA